MAYLAGARLVLMPVSLLSGSWGNYFRPLASRKLSEGDISAAVRLFFISSLAIVTLLVFYTTFVLLLLQAAPEAWLPKDYRDIGNYVLLWAVIIFITTIRSNASSIFQPAGYYRPFVQLSLQLYLFSKWVPWGPWLVVSSEKLFL